MKLFLKLLKQISLYLFFLLCLHIKAQQEQPIKGYINYYPKQFSIKAAMVVPAFYNFNVYDPNTAISNNYFKIKPDLKLSYVIGLQYKGKRNILIETQFQPYNFSFKSPIEYWNTYTVNGNMSYPYYETDNYRQYRISAGIGYQKNLNQKNSLGLIIGAALSLGDHGNQTVYKTNFYSMNGTPYNPFGGYLERKGLVDNMSKLAPYISIYYNYNLIKNLAVTANVNYSYLYYKGEELIGDFYYQSQNLLAVNIGLKFNIVNKAAKTN